MIRPKTPRNKKLNSHFKFDLNTKQDKEVTLLEVASELENLVAKLNLKSDINKLII